MANTVTKIMDAFAASGFDPAAKTTPALETVQVTFDATETTHIIVLNHATAASIHTRLIREAFAVVATPCNSTAGGTQVALHAAISTTTYPNDSITLTGIEDGSWYVLIIGRA